RPWLLVPPYRPGSRSVPPRPAVLGQVKQSVVAQQPPVALAQSGQFNDTLRQSFSDRFGLSRFGGDCTAFLKRLPCLIESTRDNGHGLRVEPAIHFCVDVEKFLHGAAVSACGVRSAGNEDLQA